LDSGNNCTIKCPYKVMGCITHICEVEYFLVMYLEYLFTEIFRHGSNIIHGIIH